ncbi:hypothetical protein [Selenihalanaerobacter shriftii]|uniref:Lipoprotein n=1 Tax=Selenihalanaerobacter shriftii TaxID=142842 RepID=A0A1T4MLT0_9FIRM|nr:hypothetical protein [Selenihalanaerobacter shriftii]SJZ67734.1 hypothetical protein SAMN02745118_01509 [Selenihalanaerobacter shriftii]
MKRKILILGIIISMMLVLIGCEQKAEANEEELLKFLDSLQGLEYKLRDYTDNFEGYLSDNDKFAKEFYEDFLKGNVEFVLPDYKTDDIKDPKLQKYLNKYLKFNFILARTKKIEDEYIIFNIKFPHYNFKVYQIDFDNNKENGKEDVFYSSGYWNEEELSKRAVYDVLNEKEIKNSYQKTKHRIGGEVIEAEYVGKNKKRTKNYTGIIKYKNRYYIYEVWDWDIMAIIKFYCWNKKAKESLVFLKSTIELEAN